VSSAIGGVVGWDIGGVNTKVARLGLNHRHTVPSTPVAFTDLVTAIHPFEIQREPAALSPLLTSLAHAVGARNADVHAVTMTAELSQMFQRKRNGVDFVLDAVARSFPRSEVTVYATDGTFLPPAAARAMPMMVAAANWAATARAVAAIVGTAVIVDVGSTTTDVIPIVDRVLRPEGWTDPDRLRSGELLYLGAVRTPVEAITHVVPLADADAGVSAEAFALAGDVYLWRGALPASAYTTPTPDGRDVSRTAAGERLARVVCADRELLDDTAIDRIADAVAARQRDRTATAVARVARRHPCIDTAVVMGVGDFIAAEAAALAGLRVRYLAADWGGPAARVGPAAAVALLRAREATV
jgi:probable H4MPT-linked C1 transfer pathway protein